MIRIVRSYKNLYEFTGNSEDTKTLDYLFLYYPTIVDGRVLYDVSTGSNYTDTDTGTVYIFNAVKNKWSVNQGGSGGTSGDCEGILTEDITVMGTTVGNFKENDILLEGDTFTTVMKNMLTKEIVPSYSMPTISINSNVSGIKEVGISVNPIISVTFNKNDGGTITLVEIYRGNELINSKTNPNSPYSFTESITLTTAQVTYKAKISYEDGPIKNTNLGNPYPTGQIKAGSKTSGNTSAIVPVYASYIGVIDSAYEVSSLNKIVKNTKAYTYKYSMSNQRIVYLYPSSFGELTSIKDENNFENLDSFAKTLITINGVSYIEYKLINTASNSDGTLFFN